MKQLISLSLVLTASMVAYPSDVLAQSKMTLACTAIGGNAPEVLDSKQGHSVSNNDFVCRIDGGLLDNGWATGHQVYEFVGPKGVGRAGMGVARHPNGVAVWVNEVMTNDLQLQDGKVAGFHATGKGRYTMASGAAKELDGRTYSYVARPTGPGQFDIDVTVDEKR